MARLGAAHRGVDRRTTIGKALGVLMVRYDLTDDQALGVLRRVSSHHNRKLYDLAVDVITELALPASTRSNDD